MILPGADPTDASKDGRPETYTSEPAILDLLQAAVDKLSVPPPQSPYLHDTSDGTDKHLYAPPLPSPDTYIYYPSMNSNMNDGVAYYLPNGPASPNNGIGHLPPPEIARMIPCRYFPACRYGSQCIFLHPQGPYYQGAMPPYPPYDPMANPYGPSYFPPPPPFQQPPNVHSVPPITSLPNSSTHDGTPSEVISTVPPFTPNGPVPPPSRYAPPSYPPPGPLPMQFTVPLPHLQSQSQPNHPSPSGVYDMAPIVTPYPVQPNGPYSPQGPLPNGHYVEPAAGNAEENTSAENPNGVNAINHHRRGSMRHPSYGSRKPPCLFFPSGRCKNGYGTSLYRVPFIKVSYLDRDDCRFPHILPDGATVPANFSQVKGGSSRSLRISQSDRQGTLAEKLSNLTFRDDQNPKNGVERPYAGENRLKFQTNGKHHYHPGLNGHSKKSLPVKQHIQRVPKADEFPVLAGTVTPPKLVNGNGHNGLTAAQVLQAPPPRKDTSRELSSRNTTPEPGRGETSNVSA